MYIFKDGKMAQESRFGRAVYLNVGASVSTKDGRNIAITSNEVARLGSLLQKEHGG
ncbi:TPA: CopK family periplasmic copper-binding protein [Pseudomonas aeruginosa]